LSNWRGVPNVAALLPSLLMREHMPRLQTLRIGTVYANCNHGVIESALLAALPRISSTLTELDLKFTFMLTQAQSDDWLPGFHLLPSLRILRCDFFHPNNHLDSAFARSIALAPKLEVLQLHSESGASEVCEQLQLRCEAASGNGSGGGGGSGAGGGLGTECVALRELHLSDGRLSGADLSDLALLPNLEHLKCRVSVGRLGMLGGLRRLRSLELSVGDDCTDAAVQQLSRLRLPHLQSLTFDLADPSGNVTVRNGARHLLEIPSLTRLQLPWLSADQAALMRLLHRASGPNRRGLFIDTFAARIPSSRSVGLFDV